ncbi:hypothetical protein FHG64_07170 [Antarcticibacterium flavum]|uniref:Uncharacterized protein n=1 Tax=Antarcticibacterium flavum TaxID=2058175 RepID=A0A5B7X3F1_9FLAO|nr:MULTISPECIES: hypothetical protein [Antarcticibacterium]MCM4160457.1 hypothetical protein [Antarcticibacterium sp. W02-3]QCY69201.1 hypothetical protein FHG64_07170 [Antarcticibacterium flavum]
MKTLYFTILFLFSLQFIHGQHINSYRYVVIPAEFDFQKETNQYQLNELLKFLFEREGFEAYLDNETFPAALSSGPCKALRARVKDDSGMFRTRLAIELRDCNNNEVFITPEGVSKLKDYQQAYHEALREAFTAISNLNYKYAQEENVVEVTAVPPVEEEKIVEVTAVPPVDNEKEVTGEVERELPVETKDPVAVEGTKTKENDGMEARRLLFQKEGSEFFLEKTPSGYNLYQKGMSEPFASLVKSSARDSYLYTSVTAKGMANFDNKGNLTVEVLDPQSNSPKTTVYSKQDQ